MTADVARGAPTSRGYTSRGSLQKSLAEAQATYDNAKQLLDTATVKE